jgi:hypothetical protein
MPARNWPRDLEADHGVGGQRVGNKLVEEKSMKARRHRTVGKEKALAARLNSGRDEWDETPIKAEIQSQRAVVTSLRLPVGEFTSVQKAAGAAGQTVSEFIRSAIATRLHGGIRLTALKIEAGSSWRSQVTVLAPTLECEQTRNPDPEIVVPQYENMTR